MVNVYRIQKRTNQIRVLYEHQSRRKVPLHFSVDVARRFEPNHTALLRAMISFSAGNLDYMLLTVTLFILYQLIVRLRRSHLRPPYPPGPSGWPFIGNLHTPPEPAWKTYNEWSELYGAFPKLCCSANHGTHPS